MTEPNPETSEFPKQLNPFEKFSPDQIRSLAEPIQAKALEYPEERTARLGNETKKLDAQLEQQKLDASYNRKKEVGLIVVLMIVIGFSLFTCFQIVNSDKASEDIKKAATAAICSVLTSTISGIGAYIAGTKSAKPQ